MRWDFILLSAMKNLQQVSNNVFYANCINLYTHPQVCSGKEGHMMSTGESPLQLSCRMSV